MQELDTMLQVIVGQTFHGTLAPVSVDDTPEHLPPNTVRDFDEVLPLASHAARAGRLPGARAAHEGAYVEPRLGDARAQATGSRSKTPSSSCIAR